MKLLKKKEYVDFCEICAKDIEQKNNIIECDMGCYHYLCRKCIKELKQKLKEN